MSPTYWCERAWLGSVDDGAVAGVRVSIEGDRIAAVTVDVAAEPGDERLPGLTVPGFANAHSHAFHRALRGRTHGDGGTFWTWRDQMYELADRLDPDRYRALATAAFAEMALAGFTSVGEFHYLHHDPDGRAYAEPNVMAEALRAAATEAGVRLTLLDTCYLHGGFDREPDAVQRRFADADADAWAARAGAIEPSQGFRVGAAIHSVRAVDPEAMEVVARWATSRAAPLHAHVSEQPAENEQCLAVHGITPTEVLARNGVLGERFTAVHATHVTAADIDLLASSGSAACLCPTTERDLGDGIGPAAALAAAGVALCLGTDSHAVVDPFEEARAVELDERLTSGRRGTHTPGALLAMATAAEHRALGWPDTGKIAPGALADLVTIGFDSVRLAGTSSAGGDPIGAVVFAASAADVRHVVASGEVVVDGGAHVRLDVAQLLEQSIAAAWP